MSRERARTVFLVIAAWVMGATMGSQILFRHPTAMLAAPVRFPPGVYQIERAIDGGQAYWVDYDTEWQVRFLDGPIP